MVQAVKVVVETVGLSEPKQGRDLFSRAIVKFLTHWVGEEGDCGAGNDAEVTNCKAGRPGTRNVGVAGGGSGSYSVILWCLTKVRGWSENAEDRPRQAPS